MQYFVNRHFGRYHKLAPPPPGYAARPTLENRVDCLGGIGTAGQLARALDAPMPRSDSELAPYLNNHIPG
jgi:hypothetical protein